MDELRPTYHVISDASMRHGSVGYAYSITDCLCPAQPRYVQGFLPECKDSACGEILASAIALAAVPLDAGQIILWTDLDKLQYMIGRLGYGNKLDSALNTLRMVESLYAGRVVIASVDRDNRIYKACHKGAYKAAMLCALETGRYHRREPDKVGPKKKKWPRRAGAPQ